MDAAKIIVEKIKELLEQQETVMLAVPGGRSVKETFGELAIADLQWDKIHIFMVDERLVPKEDPESNYQVVKIFADKLPKDNVHPFVMDDSEDNGVSKYSETIKKHGGKFDIVLLSAGEEGHVGSLYPNHPSIKDESEYYIKVENSPKPPANRMSATKKLISTAKVGIILFLGEGKRDAYNKFKDENITVEQCPAKIVNSIADSHIITDLE